MQLTMFALLAAAAGIIGVGVYEAVVQYRGIRDALDGYENRDDWNLM